MAGMFDVSRTAMTFGICARARAEGKGRARPYTHARTHAHSSRTPRLDIIQPSILELLENEYKAVSHQPWPPQANVEHMAAEVYLERSKHHTVPQPCHRRSNARREGVTNICPASIRPSILNSKTALSVTNTCVYFYTKYMVYK